MTVGDDRRRGADRSTARATAARARGARRRAARDGRPRRPTTCDRYPHEFSGGQRQRIGIARALARRARASSSATSRSPRSTSRSRRRSSTCSRTSRSELGLTYLFIAHDLSRRAAHLRPGRGDVPRPRSSSWRQRKELYTRPAAPVHRGAALGGADPRPAASKRKRIVAAGRRAQPVDPPSGCRFHPRCPIAQCRSAPRRPRS